MTASCTPGHLLRLPLVSVVPTKCPEHHFSKWRALKPSATSHTAFLSQEESRGSVSPAKHRVHKRWSQEALKTLLLPKGHRTFPCLHIWGSCPGETSRVCSLSLPLETSKSFSSLFFFPSFLSFFFFFFYKYKSIPISLSKYTERGRREQMEKRKVAGQGVAWKEKAVLIRSGGQQLGEGIWQWEQKLGAEDREQG